MGKQDFRSMALGAACLAFASSAAAFTSPRDGGALPDSYFQTKAKDAQAFTVKRAWKAKAAQLRAERRAFLAANGPEFLEAGSFAVSGTLHVPVLPGYDSAEATAPVSAANLDLQLFTGNATGTITDYYNEVSYGQLTVTGDVYSWADVSRSYAYYTGSCNGVGTGCSNTGEFIEEVIAIRDPTVNFGLYDNDGPDGTPNSGDDDGFVDVAVFVQRLPGGECGGPNTISHSWIYSAWPNSGEEPYRTGDARTGGGFIQIDEYVVVPSLNCGATAPYTATEWIDVGVYCHELGHALGLPDLYDLNGGGNGIGHWGIMGTGNWNTPEKPAHMDAWCKQDLGWITPTPIGWQATPVSIPNSEQNPVAFRLPFSDERFRRSTTCVLSGAYSLYCGLTAAEAATRGYVGTGPGYGPNWLQTIERDFHYSGSGAVTLQYACRYETEANYDFAEAVIEVNGVEATIVEYTGTGQGIDVFPLTGYLGALAGTGGTYTIKFRVMSDLSFDDADGNESSTCGAFAIDNVMVSGGGEAYQTDFESSVDGWHINTAETRSDEYWLVENRSQVGFDVNLHGPGLLIWHVDDEILHAPFLLNRGPVRGLTLEEAEGVFDLNGATPNMGEPADPYPGTSGHTSLTSGTTPNSHDNLARPTEIEVTGISPAGGTMTATLKAGDPSPQATSVLPVSIGNDQVQVPVTVSGARIRHGASFYFELPGVPLLAGPGVIQDRQDIIPVALEWVDANTLRGTVNVYAKSPGQWRLVVANPDGQTVNLEDALTISPIVSARLVSAQVDILDEGVRLRYELLEREPGETIRLHRAPGSDGVFHLITDNLEPSRGDEYTYLDRAVEPGRSYTYLLESRSVDGDVRELHRALAVIPSRDMVLEQNVPNPFNPRTTIRFYLPARTDVHLDVFDVRGALVRRLAEGHYDSGAHRVDWDGTDKNGNAVASGFYVYRLVTDGRALSRKMMLLK